MKVNVLKKTKNELKIEVEGAGYTLCNLLQRKLLEDENVDVAGYDIPHPLASNPIIYVRTKGEVTPEEALIRAVDNLLEVSEEFGKALEKAFKT
ncbi:MAG: DNA-directed RNA polymerase subunit L [Candidatus Bathyarchaeia archaeon]